MENKSQLHLSPQLKHLELLKQQTEELKQKLAKISDKFNRNK